jgi:dTDP-4-amino-4,6-dideoxygalactose transaminase
MLRLCGEQEKAFEIFKEHEASFDGQTRMISRVSEILLSNLNYKQISQRRLDNFEMLHDELKGYNALDIDIARMDVPFCYPLMPKAPIEKRRFYDKNVFLPNYWPDVLDREFSSVNAKKFSLDLLPLPIDHRYGKEEMDFIIKIVKDFGKQG